MPILCGADFTMTFLFEPFFLLLPLEGGEKFPLVIFIYLRESIRVNKSKLIFIANPTATYALLFHSALSQLSIAKADIKNCFSCIKSFLRAEDYRMIRMELSVIF